ncbi:hypothetical protein COLU111180_01445 [Cohnella lubricantis]|uniref:Uncharacterized protein n=1 Tax=Cohnella lubricantis TaxID=2163172 RepID=A0A841T875_9BACL|nr:hypothetical protein [Cohnella lubricantis]MBB6676205.1 hypothetical protein [Cohnella lubricantis]MBP2117231.1 hypothetical protein [Cohnella lubricantis]
MESQAHDFEYEGPFGKIKANRKAAVILSVGAIAVVGLFAYGMSRNEKILELALDSSKQIPLK